MAQFVPHDQRTKFAEFLFDRLVQLQSKHAQSPHLTSAPSPSCEARVRASASAPYAHCLLKLREHVRESPHTSSDRTST
mgnify:CR=1 FL=1